MEVYYRGERIAFTELKERIRKVAGDGSVFQDLKKGTFLIS